MPRITTNIPDETTLTEAKVAAAKSGKSLACWSGDVVVREIKRSKNKKPKNNTK